MKGKILIAELVQHHLGHNKQGGYCSSAVRGYNYQLLLFFLKSFLIALPAENKHWLDNQIGWLKTKEKNESSIH